MCQTGEHRQKGTVNVYFNLLLSVCALLLCHIICGYLLIIFRRMFAMLSSLSVFSVADAICIVLFVIAVVVAAATLVVEFFNNSFSD